jgi:hypothetical protein
LLMIRREKSCRPVGLSQQFGPAKQVKTRSN